MNGIDSAIASLLATRVDSLLSTNAPSNATAQTGASGLSGDTPATGVGAPVANAPLPASAQTALSAVALTLDAISRFGGDATVAGVGQVPVLPAAPALDVAAGAVPLFDPPAGASGAGAFVFFPNFTPPPAPGAPASRVSASPVALSALA